MKMKNNLIVLAILLSFLAYASAANDDKILVHFTGYVEKPGSYRVAGKITIEELRDACGGIAPTATTKRMMVIRFPRQEGISEEQLDNPETRKDEILRLHQIPKEGEFLLLQDGDVIYVPGKYYIGR